MLIKLDNTKGYTKIVSSLLGQAMQYHKPSSECWVTYSPSARRP